jgi:hypothetical protein
MRTRNPIIRLFIILCLVLLAAPQSAYGNFRIIVLPDTQNYSQYYPSVYTSQTQWIAGNTSALNIAFVAHVGDVVNTCTNATQYGNADAAMDLLDSALVEYGVSPGNHDQANSGTCGSSSLFPSYFGVSRYTGKSCYQGSLDHYNHYFFFSAGAMDFIILFLQYAPDAGALNWADARLKEYPTRRGIVVSHSILNVGGTQTTWTTEGLNIFNALKDNANLFLMLCGHNHGEGRRTDTGDAGNTIYSLLADYQNDTNGGNGFLRILEFDPSADAISVTTYSPYTGTYKTTGSSQFTLSYNMLTPIYGDVAPLDCDVDGSDLASLIASPGLLDIAIFAGNFGKSACQ